MIDSRPYSLSRFRGALCRLLVVAIVMFLATAENSLSDESKTVSDTIGIQTGEKAPDFDLTDAAGAIKSLKDLLGDSDSYLALVFYRSADW